jgi:SAM-dependent methyltransferase
MVMLKQRSMPSASTVTVTGFGNDSSIKGEELKRHARKNAKTRITSVLAIATLLVFFYFSAKMMEVAQEGQKPSEGEERSPLSYGVANAPVGSLGPKGTDRLHLRYYDSLFYAAMQFGSKAKSIIEVGCGYDPFLKYMTWIPEKLCVAPYFADYVKGKENHIGADIEQVTADFMDFKLPNDRAFDLLICSQVIEHVENPKDFMQKLIRSARISIISVPYQWKTCVGKCGHKSHEISYNKTLEWSYPYVPIVSTIVKEKSDRSSTNNRRIVLVFERDDDDDA